MKKGSTFLPFPSLSNIQLKYLFENTLKRTIIEALRFYRDVCTSKVMSNEQSQSQRQPVAIKCSRISFGDKSSGTFTHRQVKTIKPLHAGKRTTESPKRGHPVTKE